MDTREQAAAFSGRRSVGAARRSCPKPADDEVYWSDLADCEVVNRNGERLGRVAEVQGTGAHPILRVARGERRGRGRGKEPSI